MKKLINQTRYVCEHCKKEYKIERYAVSHEDKCKKNPKNYQPCLNGCRYLEETEKTFISFNSWAGDVYEDEIKRKILWCDKHDKGVFPYWIGSGLDGADCLEGDFLNVQMPNKCNEFCTNSF